MSYILLRASYKKTVLKSVRVSALHFMPDGGFVICDHNNTISLYTKLCDKLDVTFETLDYMHDWDGGLTVGKDGLIFIGYRACQKIQVFRPEGGKAIREILCKGFCTTTDVCDDMQPSDCR